jgi:Holliday junction resolvase RusA-like endonuclease
VAGEGNRATENDAGHLVLQDTDFRSKSHFEMEAEKMIVTLPLPPKALSPNASSPGNPWPKIKAAKKYRSDAHLAAIAAGAKGMGLESASVQCKFFFRTAHARDSDNLLASLKSAFDGLVDAGVFTDDRGLVHLPSEQTKDTKNPRVEIHIQT